MSKLELGIACGNYDHVEPLMDGEITVEGIEFIWTRSFGSETFWRQLNYRDFDVSEFSISSYMIARSQGQPWIAIPIFFNRQFSHTSILCNRDAGIEKPADLKGKTIGVPEYQQSHALWLRGILEHEFDVPHTSIKWRMERTPERSRDKATGFKVPPGVDLERIPPEKSLGQMLIDGELDAVTHNTGRKTLVDRSGSLLGHPRIKRLFPDAIEEGIRYYRKTRMYPTHHLLVMKEEIYRRHPWVAINIFKAFQESKELFYQRQVVRWPMLVWAKEVYEKQLEVFGPDPYRYGLKANRKEVESAAQYSHEQQLTSRLMKPEELFAENTLEL